VFRDLREIYNSEWEVLEATQNMEQTTTVVKLTRRFRTNNDDEFEFEVSDSFRWRACSIPEIWK
jgi:hypothetical protein